MMGGDRPFRDRADAGRRLAHRLSPLRDRDPIVLALPRGGVPVAVEVARGLGAPLDVFVVRKLGAPGQPELGIGAVAQGGTRVLNERIIRHLGVTKAYLDGITTREMAEVDRRLRGLRGDMPAPGIRGRTVILIDDGLATGVTARVAVAGVRARSPRAIVLAVPVCAAQTAAVLRPFVDDLVSLETPDDLYAIGLWYEDFEQVPDAEVVRLLRGERGG